MTAKRKVNPELIDDENPEWKRADFARARPASEVLPKGFLDNWRKGKHTIKPVSDTEYEAKKRLGRPKIEKPKMPVTMRLDADVVKFFRAGGEGWQTRLNAFLAAHVKRASKRSAAK